MAAPKSTKKHSLPHIPHLPHKFVKHDSGTLARLDVINGSILDHVKVQGKRRSPLGGILSIFCVLTLLYFGAQTFYNTSECQVYAPPNPN
jgi:hypothetical protein